MRLVNGDEIASVQILTGNSTLLVITSNGYATRFNENELSVFGLKAGGVKSIANLGKNQTASLLAFDEEEKAKVLIFTNKGHERVLDVAKVLCTPRLGKPTIIMPCFKSDQHRIVSAIKADSVIENNNIYLFLNNQNLFNYELKDLYLTDMNKYAKKNISLPSKTRIELVYDISLSLINKDTVSHPITKKEPKEDKKESDNSIDNNGGTFEQISIFDDE